MPEEADSAEASQTAQVTLTEADVRRALTTDKGPDADLTSWSTKPATKKGDNYISALTGVQVVYSQEGERREASYIVKLKQDQGGSGKYQMNRMVYGSEGGFYTRLLPRLNHALETAGIDALRVPGCPHVSWGEGDKQLFLEDLRPRGFTVHDRRKGMDERHTYLVLHELAKLHAASFLLQRDSPEEDLAATYDFLTWEWYNFSDITKKTFDSVLSGGMFTASRLARKIGNEQVASWFETLAPTGVECLREQLEPSAPFNVVGHGDCWVNNLLFRYDSKGHPQEIMLLDFQFCRRSSLAVDLSYFLFTSLTGDVRNKHLDQFLSFYYDAFARIVAAGGARVPFSLEDVRLEFRRKKLLGLIFGALMMPALVCADDEVQELDVTSSAAAKNYVEVKRQNSLSMLEKNPLLEPRLVDLYADIVAFIEQK
ncbi:uncharacterized protein LOC119579995 isoform X2 [Penaeus monodon]|uniref:uncharacterized protein LOC119579995 isoform X1 n=1 Tax=Penaeus monodon TaxID=6687 RepID=UPI0018A7C892|nr:uncharacterized protein LOC119579995 isoform X1 [Penaeus monodon]XP_037783768.1 uncharacterized protein LOC119579995 isoform X2 [Penaeus monodon]